MKKDSGHTWSHEEDFTKAITDLDASRANVKELEAKLAEAEQWYWKCGQAHDLLATANKKLGVAIDRIDVLESHLSEIASSDLVASNLKSMARNALKTP